MDHVQLSENAGEREEEMRLRRAAMMDFIPAAPRSSLASSMATDRDPSRSISMSRQKGKGKGKGTRTHTNPTNTSVHSEAMPSISHSHSTIEAPLYIQEFKRNHTTTYDTTPTHQYQLNASRPHKSTPPTPPPPSSPFPFFFSFPSLSSLSLSSFLSFLTSFFLPVRYPHSVTPDYLPFQCYDTLQALCSYLRSLLCTHATLVGLGVGSSAASATSATLQWVLRDGAGMLTGLLFAWTGAVAFGSELKRWRLFADAINDVAMLLELLSPLLPSLFLPLLCLATICRTLCGVAAGATRAALTAHFAREHNAADLAVKEGVQETAVNLLGMVVGVGLTQWLDGEVGGTWVVFGVCTIVHVWANYKGMKALVLTGVNRERGEILASRFIQQQHKNSNHKEEEEKTAMQTKQAKHQPSKPKRSIIAASLPSSDPLSLSPVSVNLAESIVWRRWSGIHLGVALHQAIRTKERLIQLMEWSNNSQKTERETSSYSSGSSSASERQYLIELDPIKQQVFAVFHRHATSMDVLQSLLHAQLILWNVKDTSSGSGSGVAGGYDSVVECSYQHIDALYERWIAELQALGWQLNEVPIDAGNWRCEWTMGKQQ